MQAVIVTGGKQYSVKEGDVIYVEKLGAEADATVTFDQVLAVVDGENSKFGAPVVAGASVEAKVLKNGKSCAFLVPKRPSSVSCLTLREFSLSRFPFPVLSCAISHSLIFHSLLFRQFRPFPPSSLGAPFFWPRHLSVSLLPSLP